MGGASTGRRAGPRQAVAAAAQSRNLHRSVIETPEWPRHRGCQHRGAGPLATGSVWIAGGHEAFDSRPSVAEHVEQVFHFSKIWI